MCEFAALFEPGRRSPEPLLAPMEQDLLHRGADSGGRLAEPGALRALVDGFRRGGGAPMLRHIVETELWPRQVEPPAAGPNSWASP